MVVSRVWRWLTLLVAGSVLVGCGNGAEQEAQLGSVAQAVEPPATVHTLTSNMLIPVVPGTNDQCQMLGANNIDPYTGSTAVMLPADGQQRVLLSMPLHDLMDGENITAAYHLELTNDMARADNTTPQAIAWTKLVVASSPTSTAGTTVSGWQGRYFDARQEHHQTALDRVAFKSSMPSRQDRYLNVVGYATVTGSNATCVVRDCLSSVTTPHDASCPNTPSYPGACPCHLGRAPTAVGPNVCSSVDDGQRRLTQANPDIINRPEYARAKPPHTPLSVCQLTTDLTNSSMHLVRHRAQAFLPIERCLAGTSGTARGKTCNWYVTDTVNDQWPNVSPGDFHTVTHQYFAKSSVTWTTPSQVQRTPATTIPYSSTGRSVIPVMWVQVPPWLITSGATLEADASLFGDVYEGLQAQASCNVEFNAYLRLTHVAAEAFDAPGQRYVNLSSSFNLQAGMPGWTQEQTGLIQLSPGDWTGPAWLTLYAAMGASSGSCSQRPIHILPDSGHLTLLAHYPSSVGMRTKVAVSAAAADKSLPLNVKKRLSSVSIGTCSGGFVRAFGTQLVGDYYGGTYNQQMRSEWAASGPQNWMGAWRWFDMAAAPVGSVYGTMAGTGQLSSDRVGSLDIFTEGYATAGAMTAFGGSHSRLSAISYDIGGNCFSAITN